MFSASKLLLLPSPQVSLMILQNRSSSQQYVSSDVCFDFFKPFGRVGKETNAQLKDDCSNCNKVEGESNHFTDTKLWSLVVRMISFLFISSRYIFDSFYFVLEFSWSVLVFYCLSFLVVIEWSHSYSLYC